MFPGDLCWLRRSALVTEATSVMVWKGVGEDMELLTFANDESIFLLVSIVDKFATILINETYGVIGSGSIERVP